MKTIPFLIWRKVLLLTILFFSGILIGQAQQCQFLFKGTLAGQKVTMCFYADNNDGEVSGHYYYGSGKNGNLMFAGTAKYQGTAGFDQNLIERNVKGEVTGTFIGTLKNGVMTGTWVNPNGTRSYKYHLVMVK